MIELTKGKSMRHAGVVPDNEPPEASFALKWGEEFDPVQLEQDLGEEWRGAFETDEHLEPDYISSHPKIVEEAGVQYVKGLKEFVIEGVGRISVDAHFTEHNRPYLVAKGTAEQRDIPVRIGGTTALGTGVMGGFNIYNGIKYMEQGFDFFRIGPEGEWHSPTNSWRHELRLAQHVSMDQTVTNFYAVMHQLQRIADGGYEQFILDGDSRGGMSGLGLLAKAEEQGFQIPFADFSAICFLVKFRIMEAHEYLRQVALEVPSLARQLGRVGMGERLHLLETVPTSRSYRMHLPATTLSLVSGDTGNYPNDIPRDQYMYSLQYAADRAGNPAHLEQAFTAFENVLVETAKGSHLSILRPDMRSNRLYRYNAFKQEYEAANGNVAAMNLDNVLLGHHLSQTALAA